MMAFNIRISDCSNEKGAANYVIFFKRGFCFKNSMHYDVGFSDHGSFHLHHIMHADIVRDVIVNIFNH